MKICELSQKVHLRNDSAFIMGKQMKFWTELQAILTIFSSHIKSKFSSINYFQVKVVNVSRAKHKLFISFYKLTDK